jgi:cysteinyl-tRNA synthetase
MIGLNGEKMSKSLGNLVFVSRLIANGVNPMAIRWALMGHHYSTDLMWTDEILSKARIEIDQLQLMLSREEVAPTDEVINSMIYLSRTIWIPLLFYRRYVSGYQILKRAPPVVLPENFHVP